MQWHTQSHMQKGVNTVSPSPVDLKQSISQSIKENIYKPSGPVGYIG